MTVQQQIIDNVITQCKTIVQPAYRTNLGPYTRYFLNTDAQYKTPLLNVIDEPEETIFKNQNLQVEHNFKIRIEAIFPTTEQTALVDSCNIKADILEALRSLVKPSHCVVLPESSSKSIQGEGQLLVFVAVLFSVVYKTELFGC